MSVEDPRGETELAVCQCPACGYQSPGVEAGPAIGCGVCPECGHNRMNRDTQEVRR